MTSIIFAMASAVFICLLVYFGIETFLGGQAYENRKVTARLESLLLPKKASIEKKTAFSNIFHLNQVLKRQALSKKLYNLLTFSGWNVSLSVFLMGDVFWGIFVFLICIIAFESMLVAILTAVLGAGLPYWILIVKRNRYVNSFTTAFPDALMMIKGALQAGQGVQSALQIVAKEGPQPVAKEFAQVVHEIELGSHLNEAMGELYKRIGTIDLKIFVLAVFIQSEVGGNMTELMNHIEKTIRDRLAMVREIKTLSAQGKMTGIVLMLLPVALAAILLLINPGYFNPLIEAEGGRKVLTAAVVMQLIGAYIIKRITTFRVA